jgi:hypothetical protein
VKSHRLFPLYLPLSIFIPSISPILVWALGLATQERLYLTSWEEGAKGPEGKSSWQELKANFETFEMLCLGILEKAVKSFLVRKGDPQDNIKHSRY